MANATDTVSDSQSVESLFAAYYPLFLMIAGTILNSFTLLVLCYSSFKKTKKQPTIHYMRTMAIFDILILYGWNFQHFLSSVYGFTLERYNIPSCKFFLPFGYFTVQTTAWLRVFVCLDRYMALSRIHRTWFGHSKNVIIIILLTIVILLLFNLHIAIFGCFYAPDGTIDINSKLYAIFPLWDYINLAVYNFIPFIFMLLFNVGTIYHLIRLQKTTTVQNSRIRHRSISITLLTSTFLFILLTLPANIIFSFFQSSTSSSVLHLVDGGLFTYHILSFPLYLITFKEFRKECFALITCRKITARVAPATNALTLA
ncbi:unnamed protein product [Adineta ricciae]|uniref:G-protein coupled receptors family 1 profile domain-containing protein n=1 Tax=Adineta ricciae TaxID=249248 RepID=A0A814N994_ADIRI|nr:unnamed protein product [Adineta ricciae]CAF1305236.1 unnamed protein product [Adineta ricciae]